MRGFNHVQNSTTPTGINAHQLIQTRLQTAMVNSGKIETRDQPLNGFAWRAHTSSFMVINHCAARIRASIPSYTPSGQYSSKADQCLPFPQRGYMHSTAIKPARRGNADYFTGRPQQHQCLLEPPPQCRCSAREKCCAMVNSQSGEASARRRTHNPPADLADRRTRCKDCGHIALLCRGKVALSARVPSR